MSEFERRRPTATPHRLRGTRTAVIALLVLVVVLPATTGAVTYLRARALIGDEVMKGQHAAAETIADDIAIIVRSAESVAAASAQRPELLRAITLNDRSALDRALHSVHDTLPVFRSVSVVDGKGRVLAAWPHPLATALEEVATGTTPAVFPPRSHGSDALLPMRFPATAGTALVVEFSFATALPHLTSFRFGETGTATVVDTDAKVLIAGAEERRNRTLRAPAVVALATAHTPGQVSYFAPALDRDNLATYEPVEGRPFGIMVDMAQIEAFAATGQLAWLVVGSILVVAVVGALISALVGRRLAANERSLQTLRDAAQRQARTDALTGLANRRSFEEHFAAAFEAARRDGTSLAVTMFDLNRFKLLNDSRGHAAGDAALRAVAAEMRGAVRADDLAARLGGDEFAVMHPNCDEAAAHRVAARICDAVSRLGILCDPTVGSVLTVSAGTAELSNRQSSPAELLAQADVDLYRSKQQQRLLQAPALRDRVTT